jgi:TRAP-type C4-dicarboxylate transport system permease small subunit
MQLTLANLPGSRGRAYQTVLGHADTLLRVLLTGLFTVVVVAALVQVLARYVFQVTVIGPEEIARYLMVASTFLAIPVLARTRNQIAVDALAHFLPKGVTQLWLARLILIGELIFLAVFAYFAWQFTSELVTSGQSSVGLQLPLWWVTFTMVLGSVLGGVMTLMLLIGTFVRPDPANPFGLSKRDAPQAIEGAL